LMQFIHCRLACITTLLISNYVKAIKRKWKIQQVLFVLLFKLEKIFIILGELFQTFLDDAARKRLEEMYPKADVKRDDIPLDRLREILMDKLTQMDTDYSGNLKKESSSPKEPSPPPKETTPAQDKAMEEKNLGNAAYKQRNFEAAHEHYDKAIELDPNNITLLNNKAAVYFEEGNYEKCIEFCKKAVDIGRENRADYSLIGK
ncbi:Stress-induced-phosphoprotein 1, partial [Trichinella pseudospiralis]